MTTLFFFIPHCLYGISIFCLLSAALAYIVNVRRTDNDPEKRDYDPAAIFLAPFTWPLFIIGRILLSIVVILADLIAFTFILLIFILMLLFHRKPIILEWLMKVMLKVGNKLLEANTFLLREFFGRSRSPAPS